MLTLPAGTTRLNEFPADRLQKNEMQVVRVDNPPSLIVADVTYLGRPAWDTGPQKADLRVPENETAAIDDIVDRLDPGTKTAEQVITEVRDYFSRQFSYSLVLKGKGDHKTAVQNFLLNTRQGHCELFATAATLILGRAGLPARYVTGVVVHEYSSFENAFWVRQRDAHAWVRVFVNGQWQDLDTTPPGFTRIDAGHSPVSVLSDLISFAGFVVSRLRHETGKDFLNQYGMWLILPLAVILFFRLRQSSRIKRAGRPQGRTKDKPGTRDPELFYLLEHHLMKKGESRRSHETYMSWLERIHHRLGDDAMYEELKMLLHAHNRIVFGSGIPGQEKERLNRSVKNLIYSLDSSSDDKMKSVI